MEFSSATAVRGDGCRNRLGSAVRGERVDETVSPFAGLVRQGYE
jgi:hypothetical protein